MEALGLDFVRTHGLQQPFTCRDRSPAISAHVDDQPFLRKKGRDADEFANKWLDFLSCNRERDDADIAERALRARYFTELLDHIRHDAVRRESDPLEHRAGRKARRS